MYFQIGGPFAIMSKFPREGFVFYNKLILSKSLS